ncbi:MAG: histidine phosphatase family protein [Bdellovibrionales bacterium]|nr:histidine phosphatase family protein [Bdellovibrionales bacterium]
MKLFLLRHGQTQWNAEHRVMGRRDVPLNLNGQKQAEQMVEYFKTHAMDRIFSSPQLRAVQTAQYVAQIALQQIELDERLSELDFRRWEGKVLDEIKDDPVYIQRKKDPEGFVHDEVESFAQVQSRLLHWLEQYQDLDQNVLMVSHADPIRILINALMGGSLGQVQKYRVFNCALSVMTNENGFWELLVLNHRPGLDLGNVI